MLEKINPVLQMPGRQKALTWLAERLKGNVEMAERIFTALIWVPLALLSFSLGTPFLQVLFLFMLYLMSVEWLGIVAKDKISVQQSFLFSAGVIGLPLLAWMSGFFAGFVIFSVLFSFVLFYLNWGGDRKVFVAVGGLVLSLAGISTLLLLKETQGGKWFLLYLLGLVWVVDSLAYFTGKLYGRRKLAPRISPNKTWEGFFGGLAGAAIYAFLMIPFWSTQALQGSKQVGGLILLSLILTVVALGGDLSISWVKRRFGVKDAGNFFPGHGGALDRFDSFLAVVLFAGLIWFF